MRIKGRGMRRMALVALLLPTSGLAQQTHPLLVTEDWLAESSTTPASAPELEYDESTFLRTLPARVSPLPGNRDPGG